jgi:hypothetical protein
MELFRSGSRILSNELGKAYFPAAVIDIPAPAKSGFCLDAKVADNYFYYYVLKITLKNGQFGYSDNAGVKTPGKKLSKLDKPSIHIDKAAYTLTVMDDNKPVKKYPIVMGRKPDNRKLIRDMASSPEGIYEIIVLQPKATYYRAFDINYPNKIDEFRYDYAVSRGLVSREGGEIPPIGGEIQIHGKGIPYNWTAGCIALRNEDMDELFSHPEISVGTRVVITGFELTAKDIEIIENIKPAQVVRLQDKLRKEGFYKGTSDGVAGKSTMKALGDFQVKNKLPLTCQPDERTLIKLGIGD